MGVSEGEKRRLYFDNSDYLNSQIRTSYLKNSYSIDIILKKFKTKVEIDYLYEISKNLQKEANSKLQLMAEISFFIWFPIPPPPVAIYFID